MKIRVHVYVAGKVQGVCFRSKTKHESEKNRVTGWIRNLRDGGVEAIFEGEKEDVNEMIRFCEKGPPGAQVTSIQKTWEEYTGEFENFKVAY